MKMREKEAVKRKMEEDLQKMQQEKMHKLSEKAARAEMRSAMTLDQLADLERKKELERRQKEIETKRKME